jgi:chitodextrinase
MDHRKLRRLASLITGVGLVGGLTVPATMAFASPTCTATPRIDGSFVQPGLVDGMSSTQLSTEFTTLTNACITSQVVQWAADTKNNTTVYPSGLAGYSQNTTTDVVGRALTAADTANVTEYLGLQTNDDWWNKYGNDNVWLTSEATKANALADDLYAKYGTHDSFSGWYLPFEVDNWNFTSTTSWNNMAIFYTTVANHLHALTPGKPVIISPFFNTSGGQTSSQWTTMWQSILATAPIDVVALQDGVGAGHATTSQLATWFAATKTAITSARPATQLWADSETFNTDFTPLPIGHLVSDLNAVAPYVSKIFSFSYDHYDSPSQVPAVYDTTYRNYLSTGTVESSAPTTPSEPLATNAGITAIDLSWTASTDNIGIAGYRIYRNGALVKALQGSGTTFHDGGLAASTTYSYTLVAFDAAGNVSAQSSTASAATSAAPAPSPLLSTGKSYTTTLPADAGYPDTGGTELTNSATGSTSYVDAAWQGRNTGGVYSFTVDLGAQMTVNQVGTSWLQTKSLYIFLPTQIAVSISPNGSRYTPLVTLNAPSVSDADQRYTYAAYNLSGTGRYVKFTVTPASSAWSFADELTVRGHTGRGRPHRL